MYMHYRKKYKSMWLQQNVRGFGGGLGYVRKIINHTRAEKVIVMELLELGIEREPAEFS